MQSEDKLDQFSVKTMRWDRSREEPDLSAVV